MIRKVRSFVAAAAASVMMSAVFLAVPSCYAVTNTANHDNAAMYAEEYSDADIVVRGDESPMEAVWISIIGLCLFAAGVGGHTIWKKLNG